MNMVTCHFDHHDYVSAVEGFAHGSHLRQHIWEMCVMKHIPQMDDEFMDYCWWIFKRNLWDSYFRPIYTRHGLNDHIEVQCGAEDYLHALAALHRGNRYKVTTRYKGKQRTMECYKFLGNYYPLNSVDVHSWNQYIGEEYIKKATKLPMPENKMVEINHYSEWEDLSIYEKLPE